MSATERRNIPVVINNFNRLTTLKLLLNKLENAGLSNVIVLDNDSTFPPLSDFYEQTSAKIIKLKKNLGYLALWESGYVIELGDDPFIYTDSDVIPDDLCPLDFIDRLFEALITYPQLDKVGLGLRLDDLPEELSTTTTILSHERELWKRKFSNELYQAAVDTTFALYRPGRCGGHWLNGGRTAPPYLARHAPWYLDPATLDDEERYYRQQVRTLTHWSAHS